MYDRIAFKESTDYLKAECYLLRLFIRRLLLHVIIQKGGSRLSAIVTVMVLSHETTDTSNGGVFPKASDLSIGLDLVVLECLKRNGLVHTLGLLGLGVDLLFALFTTSTKSQYQVQSGFFLNVVVRQSSAVFQLLSGENQTLLIRGNSLLVLDLGLDIVDGVRRLHIESDSLSRQGLYKDLHGRLLLWQLLFRCPSCCGASRGLGAVISAEAIIAVILRDGQFFSKEVKHFVSNVDGCAPF